MTYCVLHSAGFLFYMVSTADFIKQITVKIAVTAPTNENRTPFEPTNYKTRQGGTQEAQSRGVALPP